MPKGKKGLAVELMLLMILLFFLAVSLVTGIFVNDKVADVIATTVLNSTSPAAGIISAMDTINSSTVNNSFAFIAGALILSIIITAFLSRIHPVWFFIFLLITSISLIVAAPLSNIYAELLANPTIAASVASQQTSMNYFMEHLITIIIVTGFIGVVITMSKQESVVSFGGSDI